MKRACNGCGMEATAAVQDIAGELQIAALGWHTRGFRILAYVCSACESEVAHQVRKHGEDVLDVVARIKAVNGGAK